MKQYRGYVIDHIFYNNEKEIDDFIKQQNIKRFMELNQYFAKHLSIEASLACSAQAKLLHDCCGMTWCEIEDLETEAFLEYASAE